MQLTHVSTNLRQGLRRNVSMHVAVVLTLFVSLTLAGLGLMLSKETNLIVGQVQDELKLVVYFCTQDDPRNPACTGDVTTEQKATVESAVKDNPEVQSFYYESKQAGYDRAKKTYPAEYFEGPDPVVRVKDYQETMWITLKDPKESAGLQSEVDSLDGVSYLRPAEELVGPIYKVLDVLKYGAWIAAIVLVLAAIMMVANTIRLAALARRKEIEIMRLVGASRFFIALPFLLEALVTAAIGVLLAGGSLAALMEFGIVRGLDDYTDAIPFIGWDQAIQTLVVVAIAGPVLTVLPTLLLTRKYLRI